MIWPPFDVFHMTAPVPAEVHDLRDFDFDPDDQESEGVIITKTLYEQFSADPDVVPMTDPDYIAFAVVLPGTNTVIASGLVYNLEFFGAEDGVVELLSDAFVVESLPGVKAVIMAALDGFIAVSTVPGRPSIRIKPR